MARKLNRLTVLELKAAAPEPGATSPKLYADGGGLYLQVTPQGSKSFLFRYTFDGKPQVMGLGPTHTIGLADARTIAQRYRAMILDGIDPKAERQAKKADREHQRTAETADTLHTFQWCAEQYIETHKTTWRNEKHVGQWSASLATYAYPKIGKMGVQSIKIDHVLQVLQPIWHKKTETATRVRGRIERVLGWATVKGYRSGDNPARWKAFLSEALPQPRKITEVEHHPAVPHAEISAFLAGLRKQPDSVAVRALEFLILTAARTGEVIGATWSEMDLTNKVWAVPKERMKSKRPHVVPLSDRAVEILGNIAHLGKETYVFRGRAAKTHVSNMSMLQLMRRMGLEAVPHGMRSTFRDWVADMTDFPRELAEAALAHVVGDATEAAYLRSDRLQKRRAMMDAWAAYCLAEPDPKLVLEKYSETKGLRPEKKAALGE
jgi:integrase